MKHIALLIFLILPVFAADKFEESALKVPAHIYEVVDLGSFDGRMLRVVVFSENKKVSYPYLQWLERDPDTDQVTVISTKALQKFNFKSESTNYRSTRSDDELTIVLNFSKGSKRKKIKLDIGSMFDIEQTAP